MHRVELQNPDEDDSRVNSRSRVFAAIFGGTIIGPVIEVQSVTILDHCGLEIAQMIQHGHPMV